MQKVILTKGLPASGKSTWAKEQVDKDHIYKRISMDDLRQMIDNNYWDGDKTEEFIRKIRNSMIKDCLTSGYNIIVDATNLDPKHEKTIREIIEIYNIFNTENKAELEIKSFLDVPIEECIARDAKRINKVGEKVIRGMAKKYNIKNPTKIIPYDPSLPDAIIVDVDGTLAHNNTGRGFFDWKRVNEDTCDEDITEVLIRMAKDNKIIVLSARMDCCEAITRGWLCDNGVPCNKLIMRKTGDYRPDEVVKEEIYHNEIEGKYNVLFVMDDRNKVVKMWRSLGLKCWQVASGDF